MTSLWKKVVSKLKQPQPLPSRPKQSDTLADWEALIATNPKLWKNAKRKAANGPHVLIATAVGGLSAMSLPESLLAVALTLRGARVHTLLCDAALPACLRVNRTSLDETALANNQLPEIFCKGCFQTGQYLFKPLGLTDHTFGDLLSEYDQQKAKHLAQAVPLEEIETYQFQGWNIGEHAYAGALRFFASGNLDNEPNSEDVVRRYFEGALLTAFATQRLLKNYPFDVACFNHGIYSPPGIIGEVCRHNNVRVVNWNVAYRKRCFIFSHGTTYHHTMLTEPVDTWKRMAWSPDHE